MNITLHGFTKKKILRVHVKNKPCNSPACNFIKKRLQQVCVPVDIPKVLGTTFLIEQLWWLLLNYILVSAKKILKKKVSGEIASELISLFHVQIQELASRSTTSRAFVSLAKFSEFYYDKIFETRYQWRAKYLCGWM